MEWQVSHRMNIYWFSDRFSSLLFLIALERNLRFGRNLALWDLMYSVNWKSISAHHIRVPLIYISYHAENLSISIREEDERGRERKKEIRTTSSNKLGQENGTTASTIHLPRESVWSLECDFTKSFPLVWIINVLFRKLLIITVGARLGFFFSKARLRFFKTLKQKSFKLRGTGVWNSESAIKSLSLASDVSYLDGRRTKIHHSDFLFFFVIYVTYTRLWLVVL